MAFKKDAKSLIDVIEHLSSGVSVDYSTPAEQQPAEQQSGNPDSEQAVSAKPPPDSEPPPDT